MSSSVFQYSERTIATTETNDTSEESSKTQLFRVRKFEGMALLENRKSTCRKKHILFNLREVLSFFNFMPSMTCLEAYVEATITFRVSF